MKMLKSGNEEQGATNVATSAIASAQVLMRRIFAVPVLRCCGVPTASLYRHSLFPVPGSGP